jgi:hypothetical protein
MYIQHRIEVTDRVLKDRSIKFGKVEEMKREFLDRCRRDVFVQCSSVIWR